MEKTNDLAAELMEELRRGHEEHDHDHHHDEDCCCGHDHEHDHDHEHHHHDHGGHGECCEHHQDHDHHEEGHDHHVHDENCTCGCHDHDHHHHHGHHADEVFSSWGVETPRTFTEAEIRTALEALDTGKYGAVLRAKGIVPAGDGIWLHFDFVPGDLEIRHGAADVTGRLCVIGSQLSEDGLKALFGV